MVDPKDNGGPPDTALTARMKLECIRVLVAREDISAVQKCIGTQIILDAERDWSSQVKTGTLQRAASAKDRETVFRATKHLDHTGVIAKASGRGQAGRFTVLPPNVISAVVDAYTDLKSGRVEADQSKQKWSGETGRHKQSARDGEVVGSEPTSQEWSGQSGRVSPDQSGQTRPVSPDHFDGSLARAYKELPSEVLLPLEEKEKEKKEKEPVASTDRPSTNCVAIDVFNSYNDLALRIGLPIAKTLPPSRRRSIEARLREHGGYVAWQTVLLNIEKSAFLRGQNDRNWRPPGLDWFLKPANFIKVFEGVYLNGAKVHVAPVITPSEIEANEAFAAAQGWVIPNQGVTRE